MCLWPLTTHQLTTSNGSETDGATRDPLVAPKQSPKQNLETNPEFNLTN